MSMSQTLAPHLPYLRRYARALCGSQASGDTYVRAALSALLAGDQILIEGVPPRVSLYRVFHAIWSSASGRIAEAPSPRTDAKRGATPEARLKSLDSNKRAALLLTAVEAFSLEEAAFILDETAEEVERAIVNAQQTIDRELASRVLIIEDEPIIAMDIETIVRDLGHNVTGVAVTRDEAVAQARQSPPGLVLADIQLADDSSGIDAVKDILAEFSVPVIFITAFPERLLTGTRPEPTFLITKPFQRSTVKAAIAQALFFDAATVPAG
jgi:CheY-like chemotaxis protein